MAARHARPPEKTQAAAGAAGRTATPARGRRSRRRAMAVAAAVLLGLGTWWCSSARVPTTVRATGVLLAGERPTPVASPAGGLLAGIPVTTGQRVHRGQTIASVTRSDGTTTPVKAADDGVVAAVLAGPGSCVKRGAPLVTVDRERPARALLLVEPARSAELRTGQRLRVALPETSAAGTVTAIDAAPVDPGRLAVPGAGGLPGAPAGGMKRAVWVTLDPGSVHPGPTSTPLDAEMAGSEHLIDVLLPRSGM